MSYRSDTIRALFSCSLNSLDMIHHACAHSTHCVKWAHEKGNQKKKKNEGKRKRAPFLFFHGLFSRRRLVVWIRYDRCHVSGRVRLLIRTGLHMISLRVTPTVSPIAVSMDPHHQTWERPVGGHGVVLPQQPEGLPTYCIHLSPSS